MGPSFEANEKLSAEAAGREPIYDPEYSYFYKFLLYSFRIDTVIDIATTLPTWVLLFKYGRTIQVETVGLQTFRILRVFKLLRSNGSYAATTKLLYTAFAQSMEPLAVFAFTFVMLMVLGATVMYACEGGKFVVTEAFPTGSFVRVSMDRYTPSPVESVYDSIPTAMYFMGATLSTLGYGKWMIWHMI